MTLSWVGCQQELGGLIENGEHSAEGTHVDQFSHGLTPGAAFPLLPVVNQHHSLLLPGVVNRQGKNIAIRRNAPLGRIDDLAIVFVSEL